MLKKIKNINQNSLYFSCARHAFKKSLELINFKETDAVLIPEFICRDLLASVNELGGKIIFYPVDNKLRPLNLPLDKNIKAILIVNYFGFAQNLDIFKDYSLKNNIILIEDNAHGYLSSDIDGTILGKRTDIGFISFRKILPVYDGAILHFNTNNISNTKTATYISLCKDKLPFRFKIKNLFRKFSKYSKVPLHRYMEIISRLYRYLLTGYYLPEALIDAEQKIGYKLNMNYDSYFKIQNVDKEKEIKRRRNLYKLFLFKLKDFNIEPLYPNLPDYTSPYGFPFYSSKNEIKKISRLALSIGFDCNPWPDLPLKIIENCPKFYKKLYFIDFLE
jgi:hypothetical protein